MGQSPQEEGHKAQLEEPYKAQAEGVSSAAQEPQGASLGLHPPRVKPHKLCRISHLVEQIFHILDKKPYLPLLMAFFTTPTPLWLAPVCALTPNNVQQRQILKKLTICGDL